jgi:hypothetical protein
MQVWSYNPTSWRLPPNPQSEFMPWFITLSEFPIQNIFKGTADTRSLIPKTFALEIFMLLLLLKKHLELVKERYRMSCNCIPKSIQHFFNTEN